MTAGAILMAKFPEYFIRQVAQATDIVDLVGQYVALKKRGREFVGLCPFHDDKHPSMTVSAGKQIFKCFVCGAGGGVFNFLVLYEKLTFPQAVKSLAERAHVPLPKEILQDQTGQVVQAESLHTITAFAARFYQDRLASPAGSAALAYARERGLTDESIKRFGLGYAPDGWEDLLQAGRRAGISEGALVEAGLAIRRQDRPGCYDRFRNRLMFPIIDTSDKVIAFGGRTLSQQERAKYLNSPDSPLFDKSSQLYGLNLARSEIASTSQAIVVEGYLDVLIPQQAGIKNAVATLGTALTDQHVRLLSRYAREIVLVFDADSAGQAAAERALELFLTQQIHVRVATVDQGKDPCDFVLARGAEAFREMISHAPDALEFVWNRRQQAWMEAGGNLADRARLVEDFLRLVTAGSAYGAIDDIRRAQLAQHVGHMLHISPVELHGKMQQLARRISRASAPADSQAGRRSDSARLVLEVLLNQPDLFDRTAERIGLEDFTDPELEKIVRHVWRLGGQGRLRLEELLACEDLADQSGVIADLSSKGERRGNYEKTLEGAVEHLLARREQSELGRLKMQGLTDQTLRRVIEQSARSDQRRRPKIT